MKSPKVQGAVILTALFAILVGGVIYAQQYSPNSYAPSINDTDNISLKKINGVLYGQTTTPSISGLATIQAATIWSTQTSATGSTFVSLPDISAKQVRFINTSGTTLEVRRGGTGTALPVPTNANYTFRGLTNSNELSVRRTDVSNTQVAAYGEAER